MGDCQSLQAQRCVHDGRLPVADLPQGRFGAPSPPEDRLSVDLQTCQPLIQSLQVAPKAVAAAHPSRIEHAQRQCTPQRLVAPIEVDHRTLHFEGRSVDHQRPVRLGDKLDRVFEDGEMVQYQYVDRSQILWGNGCRYDLWAVVVNDHVDADVALSRAIDAGKLSYGLAPVRMWGRMIHGRRSYVEVGWSLPPTLPPYFTTRGDFFRLSRYDSGYRAGEGCGTRMLLMLSRK
jgi:hypothetical protein